MSLVCISKCHLWQLLHIQGPNTTNRHVYQQETHLPWTWEPTTGFRGMSACAPKAAPQLQACLQPSKVAELPPPFLKTNRERKHRSMRGDNSGELAEPYSNVQLTREHYGRNTSLLNETQSQPYRVRASTRSTSELGGWDMRSERPLLIPPCHRRPQEDMPASPPHSVQLWPDPTACRAPGRACDNYLYAHLQGLSIVPRAM